MEEKPQKDLASRRLSSAAAVIDALGGTKAVADLLDVGQSSVSNYRKLGFPARTHFALSKICAERGLDVADAVFGGINLSGQPLKRAAAALPRTQALDLFTANSYQALATPVLQPAAPFIDRMGEEMRRRLYMFADPAGEQLCLRPDLTIPTALAYLANGDTGRKQLAYEGMAFRYQSRGAGKPEEFIQAGIEIIGGTDAVGDDAQVLRDMVQTLNALGVKDMHIRLNHFAMLPLFLTGLRLTPRAAARLERAYHQSADFVGFVSQMAQEKTRLADREALAVNPNAPVLAGRSAADIQARLDRLRADAESGLSTNQAEAVSRYMALSGPVGDVLAAMAELAPEAELATFTAYWDDLIAAAGLATKDVTLDMSGGRKMAYYTGLSFEVLVPQLGAQAVIAAGGRYDDLLQAIGATQDISAVGAALALERVAAATTMQTGQQGGRL
jgi:ATP phosphoribosyltransferase regulatory subunit